MKEFELKINNLEIEIGMPLKKDMLLIANIKKIGFLSGLLISKKPNQKVFWSKNCIVTSFSEEFILAPILDSRDGLDTMFGTSAYLYFAENKLEKLTFQLIGNDSGARWAINQFSKVASKYLGKSIELSNQSIWNDNPNEVIVEKKPNSLHAHFHWQLK